MQNKNYYKILELAHSATQQEIKKAYRHLAMQYHPDKNVDKKFAEAHFREIQEAYQVLSNPNKRSAYNQARWYRESIHRQKDAETVSPQGLLKKCEELNKYIFKIDSFRINQQALHSYIMHLLSETNLNVLIQLNNQSLNSAIIKELLMAGKPLQFKHMRRVGVKLIRLAGSDSIEADTVYNYIKQRKIKSYWQQYQPLVILFVTLLLCWLIYLISK